MRRSKLSRSDRDGGILPKHVDSDYMPAAKEETRWPSSPPAIARRFRRRNSPNPRSAPPIEDKAHARNAKARASQAVKAGRMSKAEEREIDEKADAVLKKS